MTISSLPSGSEPLYERLASHITNEIASGAIAVGTRLPPQRALAADIGTTVGTVGRAYDLLQQHGLVHGTVGKGTFVLGAASQTIDPSPSPATASSEIAQRLAEISEHLAAIRTLLAKRD